MRRTAPRIVISLAVALLLLLTISVRYQLELSAPAGPYGVSQTVFRWVDTTRPESLTEDPNDFREVIALVWYPAKKVRGASNPYFPDLAAVSKALVESGEVQGWQAFGLQFVRSHNLINAEPAKSNAPYPILLFSPGNATNMEFYSSLASEIASHGYVVVGLNHPYDVAAVELSDHRVASFYKDQEALDRSTHQAFIAGRIKVRTVDVLFTLKRLEALNSDAQGPFAGLLDLRSLAIAGHSLGGLTASEACKADARFQACLNFDGLQKGGPFSMEETAIPPDQPFMFITKEAQLHPKLIEAFESTSESYWVVVHGAAHDSFTDGPLLQPHLLPTPNRADQIMHLIQIYTLAFLDQTLKRQNSDLLARSVDLPEISVKIFLSQ